MSRYYCNPLKAFKNVDSEDLCWFGSALVGASTGYGFAMREAIKDYSDQKFGVGKIIGCSSYGIVGVLAGGVLGMAALGTSPVWVPILATTSIVVKINSKTNEPASNLTNHPVRNYQQHSKD